MSTALRRPLLIRCVLVLAALDWVLAASLTVADVNRPVAVPLWATAAGTVLLCNASVLQNVLTAGRRARSRGDSGWVAVEETFGAMTTPGVARLALREPRLVWSILLLLRGRRVGTPHPVFGAHRDALPVWLALGGVAVVEMGVTALLPLPSVVTRVLLVLGGWGVLVVMGCVAALVVHPHVVRPDVVLLRFGFWQDVPLPREAVRDAVITRPALARRGLSIADGQLVLAPAATTNVLLVLHPPLQVRGHQVVRVRAWADDPAGFVAASRP